MKTKQSQKYLNFCEFVRKIGYYTCQQLLKSKENEYT